MRESFEIRDTDAGGRIGKLTVPRAGTTVETPALLPVINPNLDTISPRRLADEFGAEILITNSYIIHGDDTLHERALEEGLHDLLDFPGAIMTDSGSFQLSEYGEIDVTTEEILDFQREIGSDIATPVDIPTPPDVSHDRAASDLETTQERLEIAEDVDTGEMLVSAPVQGSTYPDLREQAGRHATGTDLDVFPVGAVVPLMNDYRYDDMIDVVAAAKRGLGADAPVHLFGAGHPMMFALAVAAGCDLFDSAAYALYARDDRYLTVRGTRHLADLDYLPCSCAVCTDHSPAELRALPDAERESELAAHNLHVTFAEIRRIKQAIRAGNLLELVEQRARSHPAMLDGYRTLLDHAAQLARSDPVSKGSFFYTSHESARRPEVVRHHRRLERLSVPDSLLLTVDRSAPDAGYDDVWRVQPPFGPFPRALSKTYPLTAETPERTDRAALEAAADGVARLVETSPETDVTLAHRDWPADVLERLPDGVALVDLADEA
ncbi:7-cyano-7-deazaguanine tRNA-ribosyltransferase [Natrinema pellirubrum DSM 15624]|uniref:tRNA-guanine(15) transglycosylase n=1 Tax=Natrinema pellirubrum (strain DSM 15624 / CIP 106293 / JCM 10476 / NCIMB 786 / 157) TaxID=797303 RepID=L0JNW6_NATP1|nr:tRNA guanosine(15) transglycosylase TgtA [Natrinema pellirubrum]AGB32939.1 tRNA-guanine transglycosylase, archaeosine-15-forming [Natrinema pellirubrum DSM 15624]ELY75322.1 7-cyano-7-deazaguanine tRNA-ribosyltransferase [Natrinema pellirubrum DSM 15624]